MLALSRDPAAPDLPGGDCWNETNALDLLRREFPGFDRYIPNARILDFGCGQGWQSVALARLGAASVLGVDTRSSAIRQARAMAAPYRIPEERLAFAEAVPAETLGSFDLVISQNSFEHFPDPAGTLRSMSIALRPTGRLFVTFGPPWLAPYGSHMFFFTPIPWVNLFWRERTVMRVRSRFRADGASRYEDVEGGLNRMTLRRFETLIRASGMPVAWRRYTAVKKLDFLARVPVLREFCVNTISCILVPAAASTR